MFVTIINDCTDHNVIGRQLTRAAVLFYAPVIPVGVHNELEAAGNLIDVLDAAEKGKGVIILNVAPRHGNAKKWPNGTPFAYFNVNNILIIATIDGYSLSLIKKLRIIDSVNLLDIPDVVNRMQEEHVISSELRDQIIHTQFRSFEFAPRVAKWLTERIEIPSTPYALSQVPDVPKAIWYIDNFGNCKTTLLPEDVNFQAGKKVHTELGELACYNRLKDVPDGKTALIIGSSGYKDKRFIELIIQGKSAAQIYGLQVGSLIINTIG